MSKRVGREADATQAKSCAGCVQSRAEVGRSICGGEGEHLLVSLSSLDEVGEQLRDLAIIQLSGLVAPCLGGGQPDAEAAGTGDTTCFSGTRITTTPITHYGDIRHSNITHFSHTKEAIERDKHSNCTVPVSTRCQCSRNEYCQWPGDGRMRDGGTKALPASKQMLAASQLSCDGRELHVQAIHSVDSELTISAIVDVIQFADVVLQAGIQCCCGRVATAVCSGGAVDEVTGDSGGVDGDGGGCEGGGSESVTNESELLMRRRWPLLTGLRHERQCQVVTRHWLRPSCFATEHLLG